MERRHHHRQSAYVEVMRKHVLHECPVSWQVCWPTAPAGKVFSKWALVAYTTPIVFSSMYSITSKITGNNYGSVTVQVRDGF